MLPRIIHRAILIAVAVLLSHRLALAVGPYEALGVWIVGMGLACIGASLLLRSAHIGRITWKNRVAGYLLPWGYTLGNGRLPRIAFISWLVWSLLGLATILLTTHSEAHQPDDEAPTSAAFVVLLIAWIGNGLAILYCLGVLARNFEVGSKSGLTLLKVIGVLLAVTVASIGLLWAGYPWLAAGVAGAPLGIVGGIMGAFLLVVMIFGRNARWN